MTGITHKISLRHVLYFLSLIARKSNDVQKRFAKHCQEIITKLGTVFMKLSMNKVPTLWYTSSLNSNIVRHVLATNFIILVRFTLPTLLQEKRKWHVQKHYRVELIQVHTSQNRVKRGIVDNDGHQWCYIQSVTIITITVIAVPMRSIWTDEYWPMVIVIAVRVVVIFSGTDLISLLLNDVVSRTIGVAIVYHNNTFEHSSLLDRVSSTGVSNMALFNVSS